MIDCFEGEFDFLSNFYPSEVVLDGMTYPTVEHAYQAAKFDNLAARSLVQYADTAGRAKRMGQKVKLKPDWSKRKLMVMEELLMQKFQHPELRAKLMLTDGEELVEGNYWGDIFWGIYNSKGKNHLGKLLMSIRNGISMGLC